MTAEYLRALLSVLPEHLRHHSGAPGHGSPAGDPTRIAPTLVDLGAADGSLLRAAARARPGWALHGVDVRPAPADLPPTVHWHQHLWDVRTTGWTGPDGLPTNLLGPDGPDGPLLVVAHEWLDDLPCRVAQRTPTGWELLGPHGPTGWAPDPAEACWLEAWAGDARTVEVGLTRDRAWAAIAASLPPGSILVAIDYGHLRRDRPPEGALLGYRDGLLVDPVPDGRTNITAPVAVDALAAAVERVPGVRRLLVARQSTVMADLADTVPADPLPADRGAPLAALVGANRRRALADPGRLGANWWLVHAVGPTP
ncbi:SAM-dependent methyltransferase [Raineyella antarctica]|nr:SAM-dependent methyltransferase [Raineyella antarctica]